MRMTGASGRGTGNMVQLEFAAPDNPTGRAVVCYTPTLGIVCFIRGPET